jgi:peptidoglycan/LPS O-acetylase OafA/YrhL
MNTAALAPLRFIAALIIIFFHNRSGSSLLKKLPESLLAGPEMVTFFYVLSGFVLVLAYYPRDDFSLKEFLVKRTARIIPVYLIALSLSVAIKIFEGNLNPVALMLNVLLLQSWVPPYPLAINGPAWFLSGLVFFYVLFPSILTWLRNSRPEPKRFFFACLFLWFATQAGLTFLLNSSLYKGGSFSHDLIYYFPPVHLCSFLLGVSGAYFLVAGMRGKTEVSQARSICLLVFATGMYILFVESELAVRKALALKLPFESSFFAPIFLGIIVAFSVAKNMITSALSAKPFIFLGEISFTIYIIQNPLLYIVYRLKPPQMHYDIFLLISITLLLIIGTLILYMVERPVNAYVRSRFR